MGKKAHILMAVPLLAALLGAQRPAAHYFDPDRLVEIQGAVRRVDLEEPYGKKSNFIVLTVNSAERGLCRVEIGPQWFLENDIAEGMKVLIRASLLAGPEAPPYLIAQEISIQGERIVLRDLRGFPLWSQRGSLEDGRRGFGRHGRR